jgi:hypothetical protein
MRSNSVMFSSILFLASFGLYLVSLCPSVSVADTAELFLTGARLDVGHPPGYALEALLVRLALLLPAGGPFLRAALVPALAGAGTTALIGSTARALGARPAAAALGAFLFAASPFAWWQATMVEKYSLQLMLAALVVRSSLPYRSRPVPAAFALALAMLHHPLAVFLAPLALFPFLRQPSRRAVAVMAFVIVLAASLRPVYAAVRAAALEGAPKAVNWGEPAPGPWPITCASGTTKDGSRGAGPASRTTFATIRPSFRGRALRRGSSGWSSSASPGRGWARPSRPRPS